jgi:hypothetical protein
LKINHLATLAAVASSIVLHCGVQVSRSQSPTYECKQCDQFWAEFRHSGDFCCFWRNDLGEFFFMNHIIFHQISLAKKNNFVGRNFGQFL